MQETREELAELQAVLDRSFATAGDHLRAIVRPDRRLSARQVAAYLQGVKHIVVGTVTANGQPLAAPVDGVFWHGHLHFSTSASAVRARHLAARPKVSAAHVVGDQVGLWAYGKAQLVHPGDRVFDAFEEFWREVYGGQAASDWAPDPVYARVVADRFFAYAFRAADLPDEPVDPSGTRVEHDTMGDVRVPATALYRAQTQRAVDNFPVSGERVPPSSCTPWPDQGGRRGHQRAAGRAAAGRRGRRRDRGARRWRGRARRPVPDRRVPDRVGDVDQHERQRGAGHARVAQPGPPGPPNDDVNASQSATTTSRPRCTWRPLDSATRTLLPALDHLAATFDAKATELDDVVKAGRTHLMDADP